MVLKKVAVVSLVGISMSLTTLITAGAQESVENFYSGQVVTIMVGSSPGGGYDATARVVARHIGKYIPGNPDVIVQNVPGAASATMTAQVFNEPNQDGTIIGAGINGMPTAPLLQPEAARFDSNEINWIGSTGREIQTAIVWHTAPVQSLEQLMEEELIIGTPGVGTAAYDFPTVSNSILGLNFVLVPGYPGTNELNLAMENGEVDGNGGISWGSVKVQGTHWLEENLITVIAQYGLEAHPELPDVPVMIDLAETEEDIQALRLVFARQEYGRPYFVGPGVPEERVEALRQAFDATMEDPEFLAEAEGLRLEIDPMTGEAMAELIAQVLATPPEVVEQVRLALE